MFDAETMEQLNINYKSMEFSLFQMNRYISKKVVLGYSILSIISGLTSFLFVKYTNEVIGLLIKSIVPNQNKYLLIFTSILVLFCISRLTLSYGVVKISQELYWNIRKEIIRSVLNGKYSKVIKTLDEVHSALLVDVNNITSASFVIINFISSIILVLTCFLYIAYLSKALFLMCFCTFGIGFIIYYFNSNVGTQQFVRVRNLEDNFATILNSVLKGIKEIKVNPIIGEKIFSNSLIPVLSNGKKHTKKAHLTFITSQITTNVVFYLLLIFVLLYSNIMFKIETDILISYIIVLLYMLGPLVSLMLTFPSLSQAMISYKRLIQLKEDLEVVNDFEILKQPELPKMDSLIFKEFSFSYGLNQFSVGPINFHISRNEIVFIYGGNGSGKSTLVNLILNLFERDSGNIILNGVSVEESEVDQVKYYFSPVFSDFYVHNELYGMTISVTRKIQKYLKLFELEHKVSFSEGKYSTTNLSVGQRKRLALINALIEEKPILILDEWAADQDPYFRNKFYLTILPALIKNEDKTIIAITHDDKYYHLADRIYKMEDGKLEEVYRVLNSG